MLYFEQNLSVLINFASVIFKQNLYCVWYIVILKYVLYYYAILF